MLKLPKILPPPELPSHLPLTAKWLSGEGAGSWFVIEEENDNQFKITRFSPEGNFECDGIFTADKEVNLQNDFSITYPSHCSTVTIKKETESICFKIKTHNNFGHI